MEFQWEIHLYDQGDINQHTMVDYQRVPPGALETWQKPRFSRRSSRNFFVKWGSLPRVFAVFHLGGDRFFEKPEAVCTFSHGSSGFLRDFKV